MIRKSLFSILATLPALYSCQENHEVEIAVCCINDFHASFVADEDRNIYGVGSVIHTLDSIKSVYPHHVILSGGDNFGGSYFYKVTNGSTMPIFFEESGMKISVIGNHEFDEGQQKLAQKWSTQTADKQPCDLTYISANIRDSLGNIPHFAQAYCVNEVKLSETKSVHLSFIGLTTALTPQQTSLRHVKDLHFDADCSNVIDSVQQLPEYQVLTPTINATFIVGHIGAMRKNGVPEWEDISAHQLSQLNSSNVSGFFAAHTHDTLSGRINNNQIPIVQGGSNGRYIGMLKVKYDTVKNKVTQITPELCSVRRISNSTSQTQKLVDSLLANTFVGGRPLNEELCTIQSDMAHNRVQRFVFSEVADIVCASYAEAYAQQATELLPIIGVSHFWSIRSSLYKGTLSVLEAGEILPFANNLRAYNYSGKQLKELLTFGLYNMKFGWLQTNALAFECDSKENLNVSKVWYNAPNGVRTEILDNDRCVIVVDDYMVTGGDGYLPEFFPAQQEIHTQLPTTTTAFFNYLKAKGSFASHPEKMKKLIINGNTYSELELLANSAL